MSELMPRGDNFTRRNVLTLAAASAGTLLTGCGSGDIEAATPDVSGLPLPRYTAAIAGARASAFRAIGAGQGSGVSVAIMDRGELVYSEAMGVADRALNLAVNRQTRFNIGSVSKMFCTVAMLMLVDDGKMNLDAPVVNYLPDFRMNDGRYVDITVRMLLKHSSGLPGSTFFFGFEPDDSMQKLLLDTLRHSRLKHAPGAMSMYCNDGFTLAEIVIEKVSGQKYIDFLGARVFAPLGMNHTTKSLGESGGVNVAEYYDAISGKKYPREAVPMLATGGLASTAEDLCRFGSCLVDGGPRLLSPASLQELRLSRPVPFDSALREPNSYQQVGWDYATQIRGSTPALNVFIKGGNSGFYSANLLVLPTDRMVIAMITSGKASGDKLTEPILGGLLADLQPGAVEPIPAQPRESQPIPSALDRYTGYYALENGTMKVSIDSDRRHLNVTPLPGGSVPASALMFNDGFFYGPSPDVRFYLGTRDGVDFIAADRRSLTGGDLVMLQKLEPLQNPQRLRLAQSDGVWLLRNAPAAVEVLDFKLAQRLTTSDELAGYVDFHGARRVERSDFAAMVGTTLRDQTDLEIIDGLDGEWLRTGHYLWSSALKFGPLPTGASEITIGAGGFNEWRVLGDAGRLLKFVRPSKGRIMIVTPDSTLYDSIVDGDSMYAPAGSYVFFAGAAGAVFKVAAE
ncbi:MAG: serine hydrolase domain-containing protein [Pseudomonadota bacterium]